MKFCIIVGTRPQIIKTQPIIQELKSRNKNFTIIHTGQHYDYEMSRTFFKELKIPIPDYNLGIKNNIEIIQTITDDGKYNEQAKGFVGEHVYKVDLQIAEKLKELDRLVYLGKLQHSYPHSLRS